MSTDTAANRYTPCSILVHREQIADRAAVWSAEPDSSAGRSHGAAAPTSLRPDIDTHIRYLCEAVASDSPALFRNYIDWVYDRDEAHGKEPAYTEMSLAALAHVLRDYAKVTGAELAIEYLRDAIENPPRRESKQMSPLQGADELASVLLEDLLNCRQAEAFRRVDAAAAAGVPLLDIYVQVFQPLLQEVGHRWQRNQVSVAQEHYCSAAIQLMMARLSTGVFSSPRNGHVLIAACVGDELHEIGMRMVADALEAEGWGTHFLGANVPANDLIRLVKRTRARVLCLSVTLSIHLPHLDAIIKAAEGDASLQPLKIVVGGPPFNLQPDLWRTVGADGFASDALSAISVCSELALDG